MLIIFLSLVLLTLSLSLAAGGLALLRRGGWRLVGALLLLEGLAALAAQAALSTVPVGVGNPLIRVPFGDLLLQTAGTLVAVCGVALLIYAGGRWLLPRVAQSRWRRLVLALGLLALPLLLGGALAGLAAFSLPERERERDAARRKIELSEGFSWSIYAQGPIDNPTTITFGADGRLYIGDIAGTLWVASDRDGDLVMETVTPWANGFKLLVGLAWHQEELYVASSGKIEALRDSDGDGTADQRRTLVDGLPSMVLAPHSNNSLAFGPDGRLYFGVGSTTSSEVEMDWRAAAILSVKADGSDLRPYARGLGNSFDLAFNSEGELFAGDNSPGTGEDSPADEFNQISENGHYGFPYFFGDPPSSGSTTGPLVSFPAHSTPTGMSFYSAASFPQTYRDNAFIALWNRGEIQRIELARTSGGSYLSRASVFGKGFLYPIDIITGPDGMLYVADFGTSAIYRIAYEGR